jgi:hypothetical protein
MLENARQEETAAPKLGRLLKTLFAAIRSSR